MKAAIICNSYPTKKNPLNQIFIKKMNDQLIKNNVETLIYYNPIFRIWGNANKVKNPLATLIKYLTYFFTILYFGLFRVRSVDILFPQGILFATFFSILFKKMYGIPVVCYIHGGDLNRYYDKKGFIRNILKFSLDNSDYIVANSLDIKNKVQLVSSNKNISIISPGVDLQVMRPLNNVDSLRKELRVPVNKIILLLAGNSIRRKGFDIFLSAYHILDQTVKDQTYVVILTNGPLRTNYEQFVNQNNLQNNIEFRDKVTPEKLNEFYNIADIFVFPSREEPLGLVGLESMTSGTIVIGSEVGGIKEFIRENENGFLFKKEEVKNLSDKISFIINNFSEWEEMKPAIFKEAKEHSLEVSSSKIKNIFKELIERHDNQS